MPLDISENCPLPSISLQHSGRKKLSTIAWFQHTEMKSVITVSYIYKEKTAIAQYDGLT